MGQGGTLGVEGVRREERLRANKNIFSWIFCGHGTAGPGHPWPPNRPGSLPTRSGRLGGGERVGLRPWGCGGMTSALKNATIN